jgi:ribonucleoside-diphosphate reductase alpha chain
VTSSGYVRGALSSLVVVRSGNALQKVEAHAEGHVHAEGEHMPEAAYEEDEEIDIDERLAELSAQLRDAAAGTAAGSAPNPLASVRAELEAHFATERATPAPRAGNGNGNGNGNGGKREVQAKRAAEARLKGYEGDACSSCGNFTLVRNGTCLKCDTCGGTSGCS